MASGSARRPLLLDLFCGAGGGAVGYHRAGFAVVGVDHRPSPRYPFPCYQEDALSVLNRLAKGKSWRGFSDRSFAAIHASPPCQRYSVTSWMHANRRGHPDLVPPVRDLLSRLSPIWVIENVVGAPLSSFSAQLCGLSFGLKVFRHRLFESSVLLFSPEHVSHKNYRIGMGGMASVVGHVAGGGGGAWSRAMGVDWKMTRAELTQAIPPAYTEFIGRQLLNALTIE